MTAMEVLPLCDSSLCSMSSDELMLKELERRDGIYSFIFHELEAPKASSAESTAQSTAPPTPPTPPTPASPSTPYTPATPWTTPVTPSSPDDYEKATAAATVTVTAGVAAAKDDTQMSAADLFAREVMLATSDEVDVPPDDSSIFIAPAIPRSLPPCSPCSPCPPVSKILPTVDYLTMWQPPTHFVYQHHPQLFAYMDNCNFRVRVAMPRFSDANVPLVRNRRHPLKQLPSYKRYLPALGADACGGCFYKNPELRPPPPDLRELFPFDPDVHAPFGTSHTVAVKPMGPPPMLLLD